MFHSSALYFFFWHLSVRNSVSQTKNWTRHTSQLFRERIPNKTGKRNRGKRRQTCICSEYPRWILRLSSPNLSRKRNLLKPYLRSHEEILMKERAAKTEREICTGTWYGRLWSWSQVGQSSRKCESMGTTKAKVKNTDQENPALHTLEWST